MEAQLMIFKMKNGVSDTTNTIATDHKIWPLLIQERHDRVIERLRLHSLNRPSSPKTRDVLRNSYLGNRRNSAHDNASESFHCAMAPVLSLAQVFGLFPITGIRTSTPLKLKFNKLSIRTFYSALSITFILFMAILSVLHMIRTLNSETFGMNGGIAGATVGAVFYGNTLLGTILFFRLSPRWVSLLRDWRAMEQYIDSNKSDYPRLRRKFFFISGTVLCLALTEHILSVFNNTEDYIWGSVEDKSFKGLLEFYITKSHSFILNSLQYNIYLGVYIFIVSELATFTWNFTDIFVMLVATGLAERYKSLNKKVTTAIENNRSSVNWQELREDFAALSSMVKKVDEEISPIVLLSFANNLYFICLQLLNGLSRPSESTVLSAVYFFGSFVILVGRTVAVTLLTARINDQSKIALPCLYNCSSSSYNIETQRLQHQLTTDDVALTGLRFFSITRNFMLAVAGAIVTYEVVLLQFNVAIKNGSSS